MNKLSKLIFIFLFCVFFIASGILLVIGMFYNNNTIIGISGGGFLSTIIIMVIGYEIGGSK